MRPLAVTTWVLLCAPLLLSAGQRIYITAEAEAGQYSVTLPCGTGKETEIRAVEWSRPDLDPDVVFLYRDDRFESEDQHPSFRNRVDLQDGQMKDGDASLILKNVTTKDTGTYLCRVYQEGRGQELISTIHLEVSPPPGKRINIKAKAGQDSVNLTCEAGMETEIWAVEWSRPDLSPALVLLYRDDRFESYGQNPSFMNRVDLQDRQMKDGDASLILKDVTRNDAGTYLCTVIQGGGTRRKRAAPETIISFIHLEVSPPGTQEGGDEEGGAAGRGHPGLVLGLVSVLGIVAVIAAVLFLKRKKTPPPPEAATVKPLV